MSDGERPEGPVWYGRRRQVEGGLRARSQRGDIGESWWSQRFLDVLESFDYGQRLARGRTYARQGQVLDLRVEPGEVSAGVQGSRVRPYQVRIALRPLSDEDWERAERAMAAQALFTAALLAGEMPRQIEEAFAACELSLFPASASELASSCTCPDWARPCKHVAAVFYLLAEAFDEDPFLVFRWRGRTKEELIRHLRLLRGGVAAAPGGPDASEADADVDAGPLAPPLDADLERFFEARDDLERFTLRPRATDAPDEVLRELGPLGVRVAGADVADHLRRYYEAMTAAAERQARASEERRAT